MKTKLNFSVIALTSLFLAALAVGCDNSDGNEDKNGNGNGNGNTNVTTELELSHSGDMQQIDIGTTGNWQASSNKDWCQLVISEGTGVAKAGLNVAYNTTSQERTATITVSPKGTRAESTAGYTLQIVQKANTLSEIPPAFTEAKWEDYKVYFKMWTGKGGGIHDVDESSMKYYGGGLSMVDNVGAGTTTDWYYFNRVVVSGEECKGMLTINNTDMANSIVIEQSESVKRFGSSPMTGSAPIYFVADGKLYYGGGFSTASSERNPITSEVTYNEQANNEFYCFDPVTKKLTKLANLQFNSGMAAVLEGKPYALSGYKLYGYDLKGDAWTEIATLATEYAPQVFYSYDGKLYVADNSKRYEYTIADNTPALATATQHGMDLREARVINDYAGKIWMEVSGIVYAHAAAGYEQAFSLPLNSYIVGAYEGQLYCCNTKEYRLSKITSGGSEEELPILFTLQQESVVAGKTAVPVKNCVNIDGKFLLFGGVASDFGNNLYNKYWKSSGEILSVNVENCKPMKMLLVTNK